MSPWTIQQQQQQYQQQQFEYNNTNNGMNRESEAIGLTRVVLHAFWCMAILCSERTFKSATTTILTTTTNLDN